MSACITALCLVLPVAAQENLPYSALVDADTRFAIKFFRQAATNAPAQNIMSAPTALFLDFALLQNGADSTARQQMSGVFEWPTLSPAQINEQSAALRKALTYSRPPTPKDRRGKKTAAGERLIMAGSLWIKSPNKFQPEFIDINKRFFGFTLSSTPDPSSLAPPVIDGWAPSLSRPRLGRVSDPPSGDFSLVDTTWFKGSWVQPFAVSDTHPGDFTLLSGTKKSVPMMPKSGKQYYLRGPNFQAVGLGYWNAVLYVFLPDEDSSLEEFERSLTSDHWIAWMRGFNSREGHLELPRFKSEYHGDTKVVLQSLGMNYPFDSFSSLAPLVTSSAGARLVRALSIVKLSVDEKGTEAFSTGTLAGVVGGVRPAEPPPPPPFRMIVNRPFFFAICDRRSGAVLYLGAIVEP